MKEGIVGLITLMLGLAILAIIFILTQVKVIEIGQDAKIQTQQIQNNVNDLQNKIQQQNQDLDINP